MFKMKNKLGNVILNVKSEHRRDELLRLGFTEVKAQAKDLSSLKVDELKTLAAERGVDISTAKNKAEIIKILSESM